MLGWQLGLGIAKPPHAKKKLTTKSYIEPLTAPHMTFILYGSDGSGKYAKQLSGDSPTASSRYLHLLTSTNAMGVRRRTR